MFFFSKIQCFLIWTLSTYLLTETFCVWVLGLSALLWVMSFHDGRREKPQQVFVSETFRPQETFKKLLIFTATNLNMSQVMSAPTLPEILLNIEILKLMYGEFGKSHLILWSLELENKIKDQQRHIFIDFISFCRALYDIRAFRVIWNWEHVCCLTVSLCV